MRIGIQLLSLRPGNVGGQEVLVRRLLSRIVPSLDDERLVLFLRPELAADSHYRNFAEHPSVQTRIERPEAHYGHGYADWNLELLESSKLDVIFFPLSFFFPRPLPIPVVIHVPDIQYAYFPQYFSPDELSWRRERIPESVRLADAVVTPTFFSKSCLEEKLHADGNRLHVIASAGFLADEMTEADRTTESDDAIPQPFVFYPAADWPHKNHETLIRAMALLAEHGRSEHLVFTGMFSQRRDALEKLVNELGLTARVHFLGCVSTNRIIHLYRTAHVMAFPSRFEGFGIPLVEAMQLGCPIVASRAEGVVETVGDAARISEDDPRCWCDTLTEVLSDTSVRTDLRRRGLRRATQFDWNQCARKTMELLRSVAGS
ncbi:MAG: glycosyltransferase family 4 protein [Phycisphaerales bacterium]|nr:glycosyltransferase family 4 protein [Phycisphaerales bacterium]